MVMSAVQQLMDDPVVKETSQRLRRPSDLAARVKRLLNFEIAATGWYNIDAPEAPIPPPKLEPLPRRRSAMEATEPQVATEVKEFHPAPPLPKCPARVSSIVLGAFDKEVAASLATAHGIDHQSVDYGDEVQPDGAFSLVAKANAPFKVKANRCDGSDSYTFGPFLANDPNHVTHLGLLRASLGKAAHGPKLKSLHHSPFKLSDGVEPLIAPELEAHVSEVEVVLPRLEIPPRRAQSASVGEVPEGSVANTLLGRLEVCTCSLEEEVVKVPEAPKRDTSEERATAEAVGEQEAIKDVGEV